MNSMHCVHDQQDFVSENLNTNETDKKKIKYELKTRSRRKGN